MNELWITLIIVGLLTLGIRLSFILLLQKWQPPDLFQRSLRFVPLAVLSALIFPDVLIHQGTLAAPLDLPRFFGAATAVVVAWRSKNVFLTIGAGILIFYILRFFLP
jgi:branched-subunit amino acid transport protein